MQKDKHQKFAEIMSEYTFGFTHSEFLCGNHTYSFLFYDLAYLMVGYIGGVQEFSVRDVDGDCHTLDRAGVEALLHKAYTDVVSVRQEEFCKKYKEWRACDTQEAIDAFDAKSGWTWRSPALEAYEGEDQ